MRANPLFSIQGLVVPFQTMNVSIPDGVWDLVDLDLLPVLRLGPFKML